MTYAGCPISSLARRSAVGHRRGRACLDKRRSLVTVEDRASQRPSGSVPRCAEAVIPTTAAESDSMCRTRSIGYFGSMGTQAAPVLATAHTEATMSYERPKASATMRLRARSALDQNACQTRGIFVEFAIGDGPTLVADRDGVGGLGDVAVNMSTTSRSLDHRVAVNVRDSVRTHPDSAVRCHRPRYRSTHRCFEQRANRCCERCDRRACRRGRGRRSNAA